MSSQWIPEGLGYSSVMGVDPAVEWALGEDGVEDFFPSERREWMPVLVQLTDDLSFRVADFIEGKRIAPDFLSIWARSVRVPRVHALAPGGDGNVRFCTALVTREFFELVWKKDAVQKNYVKYVARVSLGLPLEAESLPPDKPAGTP